MSVAALAWRQLRFERRLFWRNPSAAFFNFALPLIFLLLVATVFGLDQEELNHVVPGIAAMSILTTTFTALAHNMTALREGGILKRMRGTPLPPLSYFSGVLGSAVVNAVIQVAVVIVLGHFLYDVPWPRDWLELVVVVLIGVVALGALGIALSHAIPNLDAAAAYVNAVFLPLIFISGTFYDPRKLPDALEAIASALPLKPVIDGLYGAIVSGEGLIDNAAPMGVLLAWCAVGIFLAVRLFRWE